jgi:hypothetical protein
MYEILRSACLGSRPLPSRIPHPALRLISFRSGPGSWEPGRAYRRKRDWSPAFWARPNARNPGKAVADHQKTSTHP